MTKATPATAWLFLSGLSKRRAMHKIYASPDNVSRYAMRENDIMKAAVEEQLMDDFLRAKVAAARQSMRANRGASADEVEARLAARRAELIKSLMPARESAP
ncbi:MAG TPA: hypothetical protein VF800_26440 [Telluria sp.]|jgi:hypothetical protein